MGWWLIRGTTSTQSGNNLIESGPCNSKGGGGGGNGGGGGGGRGGGDTNPDGRGDIR